MNRPLTDEEKFVQRNMIVNKLAQIFISDPVIFSSSANYNSTNTSNSNPNQAQTEERATTLARQIEETLYSIHGDVNKEYKNHYRSLSFNLSNSKNPDLRHAVWNGVVGVQRLSTMEVWEMAPEELKKEREKMLHDLIQADIVGEDDSVRYKHGVWMNKEDALQETYGDLATTESDIKAEAMVETL